MNYEVRKGGASIHGSYFILLPSYFLPDGGVIGRKAFVEDFFDSHRQQFGAARRDGARPLRGVDLPGLFTVRDLRLRVITLSGVLLE